MAGILSYEPKYESDDEDEIINELNLEDEIDGAGGLTLNGEFLCFVRLDVVFLLLESFFGWAESNLHSNMNEFRLIFSILCCENNQATELLCRYRPHRKPNGITED